jgi:hypothetical protein
VREREIERERDRDKVGDCVCEREIERESEREREGERGREREKAPGQHPAVPSPVSTRLCVGVQGYLAHKKTPPRLGPP